MKVDLAKAYLDTCTFDIERIKEGLDLFDKEAYLFLICGVYRSIYTTKQNQLLPFKNELKLFLLEQNIFDSKLGDVDKQIRKYFQAKLPVFNRYAPEMEKTDVQPVSSASYVGDLLELRPYDFICYIERPDYSSDITFAFRKESEFGAGCVYVKYQSREPDTADIQKAPEQFEFSTIDYFIFNIVEADKVELVRNIKQFGFDEECLIYSYNKRLSRLDDMRYVPKLLEDFVKVFSAYLGIEHCDNSLLQTVGCFNPDLETIVQLIKTSQNLNMDSPNMIAEGIEL